MTRRSISLSALFLELVLVAAILAVIALVGVACFYSYGTPVAYAVALLWIIVLAGYVWALATGQAA